MTSIRIPARLLAVALVFALAGASRADESFAKTAADVNKKMCKLFGSGGFKGLVAYGTGLVVSPDGYVLTVSNHLLDTQDLRLHLADGRRVHGKVVVAEPQLDIALVKIQEKIDNLPFFDLAAAAKGPLATTGTGVLAFSNQFEIATHDEPMSVQRGVVSAYAKLHGRRGIFEAPFSGEVYVIDAIMNNPGAAGGALTTRKGQLLGIIGKELRNTLTDTWINYAVPVQAKIEAKRGEEVVTVTLAEFVEKGMRGEYKPVNPPLKNEGPGGYHGIVLVPNVVERTPPYVDAVLADSPAAKGGLKPDDLIVYVNGEQVGNIKRFRELVDHAPPGTELRLEVRRGEKLTTVEFKVADPKKKAEAPKKDK